MRLLLLDISSVLSSGILRSLQQEGTGTSLSKQSQRNGTTLADIHFESAGNRKKKASSFSQSPHILHTPVGGSSLVYVHKVEKNIERFEVYTHLSEGLFFVTLPLRFVLMPCTNRKRKRGGPPTTGSIEMRFELFFSSSCLSMRKKTTTTSVISVQRPPKLLDE